MLEPPEAESPAESPGNESSVAESPGVEAWQPPSFDGRTRQTSAEDLMTQPLASKAAAEEEVSSAEATQDGFTPQLKTFHTAEDKNSPAEDTETGAFHLSRGDPTGTDFTEIHFTRENTLLTNAMSYAESIRSEVELYVQQLRDEADQLAQKSGQLHREAERTLKQAQTDVNTAKAAAQTEVEQIRKKAYEEGFEAGREAGRKALDAEARPMVLQLEGTLVELARFHQQVCYLAEQDALQIAMILTRQLLQRELRSSHRAAWKLLLKTLKTLKGSGNFRVHFHPQAYALALRALPRLQRLTLGDQRLQIVADANVPPGNVLVESDRQVIDLTFQTQLFHLEQALQHHLAEREATLTLRPPRPQTWRSFPSANPPGNGGLNGAPPTSEAANVSIARSSKAEPPSPPAQAVSAPTEPAAEDPSTRTAPRGTAARKIAS